MAGIWNEEGLDLAGVHQHKQAEGGVVGVPGTATVSNEDLLALDCDILIPAALGAAINRSNVDQVKARLIVDAANGPVTPDADIILSAKGIAVLPDILANVGGDTVSYFEWVQNLANEQWSEAQVNARLKEKIVETTDRVVERWHQLNEPGTEGPRDQVDLRVAALVAAIEYLAKVTLQRGIWP